MTRSELRTFIENGVETISPSCYFQTGRITELNSTKDITFPFIWLISPETSLDIVNNIAPFDNWSIELHIGKKDAQDSLYNDYERIVDECDLIARKLMKKYNDIIDGYATATISGTGITPFIKRHAHCSTGVVLSFTLNAPDTTSFCD